MTGAVSGYAGGAKGRPTTTVSTGSQDPQNPCGSPSTAQINYGRILRIYFSVAHNPTELDRQGPDVGPVPLGDLSAIRRAGAHRAGLYCSARPGAFPGAASQHRAGRGLPAETYHQNYLTLHPTQPYIAIHDLPKIDDLKRLFPNLYREAPVLVAASRPTS